MAVISDLFDGTVHYAHTKEQSLVNHGVLKHDEGVQEYLVRLHPSLDVKQWKRQSAKDIMDRVRCELRRILQTEERETKSASFQLESDGKDRVHSLNRKVVGETACIVGDGGRTNQSMNSQSAIYGHLPTRQTVQSMPPLVGSSVDDWEQIILGILNGPSSRSPSLSTDIGTPRPSDPSQGMNSIYLPSPSSSCVLREEYNADKVMYVMGVQSEWHWLTA